MGILEKKEICEICYENFIDDSQSKADLEVFFNKKGNSGRAGQKWKDRFQCLTCKHLLCWGCSVSLTGPHYKFKPTVIDYFMEDPDEEGFVNGGIPGEDVPIVCPFCRQKDYKHFLQYIHGAPFLIPYELLDQIRNKNPKKSN
tara:strand:- start:1608 stop:2036 length:429 start_codon:yes stop_codon:yes gene_type:complete